MELEIRHPEHLGIVLGIVVAAVFGWFAFDASEEIRAARALRNSARVDGLLVNGRVTVVASKNVAGTPRLDIEYRYSVDGREYSGDRIGFGANSFASKVEAAAALEQLQAQPQLPVYYAVSEPGISALDPAFSPDWMSQQRVTWMIPGGFAGLALVAAVCSAVAAMRKHSS